EELRLARLQDPSQRVFARVDADLRRAGKHALGDEEAERVVRAEVHRAELVRPPAFGSQRQLDRALLATCEAQASRLVAVGDLEAWRQPYEDVEPVDGGSGGE